MPSISQTFEHTLSDNTTSSVVVYNYLNQGVAMTAQKEMSQVFYEDFKTMLMKTGIDITFSEANDYANSKDCPYFEVFGLQFPFIIQQTGAYCYSPVIYRTGEYDNTSNLAYAVYDNRYATTLGRLQNSSVAKEVNAKELYYTINIDYNSNFIIASYTTIMGYKFPIMCLIKGTDINGKDVVYTSANCNSFSGVSGTATNLVMYHKIVWSEAWFANPYSAKVATPAYNTTYNASANYNGALFQKYFTPDTISNIATLDNKIHMMQPSCCGNRILFDNLYVVPDTVNVDAYYTIDGALYYCPGDYAVQNNIQYNAAAMAGNSMRFLVKL